jgi:hypothetical protein
MRLTNSTPVTIHYTVAGAGGYGNPMTPPPGTILQGNLSPGGEREVTPSGFGPWKVTFEPPTGGRYAATARTQDDLVELQQSAGIFHATVSQFVPSAQA